MSDRIRIFRSPTADTRSADHFVSEQELVKSSSMHINDVKNAMRWLEDKMEKAAAGHDWTKLLYLNEFYKQFHQAQVTGDWGRGWYDQIHIMQERHHLNDHCPDDVNLIDVIEMLCDCVMAGLARNGKYRPEEPDPEILMRAYQNTVKLLLDNIDIVKDDKKEV